MKGLKNLIGRSSSAILLSSMFIFSLVFVPVGQLSIRAQSSKVDSTSEPSKEVLTLTPDETDVLPGFDYSSFIHSQELGISTPSGVDQGLEVEPNDVFGSADALSGTDGRVTGTLFTGGPPASVGADTDFFSITTASPNSRIFASTQTNGSGGGTDTNIAILASDGATVIESDTADGSMSGTSGSIAGTLLPSAGTYYIRITNGSLTAVVANYELYYSIRSAAPTAEVEPNNSGGTPNAFAGSGFMTGAVSVAADNDTYSFNANAGDTIAVTLDIDPERDNVQWNGRLGVGTFGTPANILVVNDTSTGSVANPLSESFFISVKSSGTFFVYVDEPAGGGAATATYNLNLMRMAAAPSGSCTTYTNNTSTPLADLALTTSSITIPDSKIIQSLRATIDVTHANMPDLDVNLRSPSDNNTALFTDIGVNTQTGAQVINLADEAVIPVLFTVNNGLLSKPEANTRLHWNRGENAQGTWNLDLRDDVTANTGTLNSWSLEVCEAPAPTGNVVYNQDFETNDGGYTHSGTLDEWEYGTPATAATSTTNPVAAFNTCGSGTKCWKTDLDGIYEASSNQELVSPSINLTTVGAPATLYWKARHQVESASFDHAWVRVTEVGNPTNTRVVWLNDGSTPTSSVGSPTVLIPGSAGWGVNSADISSFAGKNIQVSFHLDSDTSFQFGGFAIDDVVIRGAGAVAAPSTIIGKLETTAGRPVASAWVTLTEQNGTKHVGRSNSFGYFSFFGILSQQTVTISVSSKRYTFSDNTFALNGDTTLTMVGTGTP